MKSFEKIFRYQILEAIKYGIPTSSKLSELTFYILFLSKSIESLSNRAEHIPIFDMVDYYVFFLGENRHGITSNKGQSSKFSTRTCICITIMTEM